MSTECLNETKSSTREVRARRRSERDLSGAGRERGPAARRASRGARAHRRRPRAALSARGAAARLARRSRHRRSTRRYFALFRCYSTCILY